MDSSFADMPGSLFDLPKRGLQQRMALAQALSILDGHIRRGPAVRALLSDAAGQVLVEDIVSTVNIPAFARAAMDGYAIRAADTFPASTGHPIHFEIIGESWPGRPCVQLVGTGAAVQIMTGAPTPEGADAVIPVELVERVGLTVTTTAAIAPNKNISSIGDDISAGRQVLAGGRRLRPQDVGLLASIGIEAPFVFAGPTVALLVTGNEVVSPGTLPQDYQILDSNAPMLTSLIRRDGGVAMPTIYVPDDPERIRAELLHITSDIVLISGGTSVGKEDYAPQLVAEVGTLLVHGIAIRPAGPAGFGIVREKLVFLLPGNPVACLFAYDLFAGRAIREFCGRARAWPYPAIKLPLAAPISSGAGRVDYVRARFTAEGVVPVPGSGGSRLSTVVDADGFFLTDSDRELYQAGEHIQVYRYDAP